MTPRRRGPLRAVVATLPDGRFYLACGHRVPPATRVYARMRCCFCPENPRAPLWRERYYRQKSERAA